MLGEVVNLKLEDEDKRKMVKLEGMLIMLRSLGGLLKEGFLEIGVHGNFEKVWRS